MRRRITEHPEVIVVCGPTASGKTAKAVELADALNGEIISVDSMQVYRQMDIGTAKPEKAVLERYPHHMIDVIDPDQSINAQSFADQAMAAVRTIGSQGKIPILVGGTGFYFKAILEGFFEAPGADPALRERLERLAKEKGPAALHEYLARLDPETASDIHPNNVRRVIRAIEIRELSGKAASGLKKNQIRGKRLKVREVHFLNPPREALYANIDKRVEMMFDAGLVEEVRGLIKKYDPRLKAFEAIGYKEVIAFLQGKHPFPDTVGLVKKNTRNYAKRQVTWFTRQKIG
jgi:tRNA dimethylallyltransferase